MFQVLALPLGLVVSGILILLWWGLTPIENAHPSSAVWLWVSLVIMFPVHESLHGLAHPGCGASSQTVYGYWPSRMMFFAHYEAPLNRERSLLVLAMPFIGLSILPLAVAIWTQHSSWVWMFLSWINAVGSGGDLFAILLLLRQTLPGAMLCNSGYFTYRLAGTGGPLSRWRRTLWTVPAVLVLVVLVCGVWTALSPWLEVRALDHFPSLAKLIYHIAKP